MKDLLIALYKGVIINLSIYIRWRYFCLMFIIILPSMLYADDYHFDLKEIEKKELSISGIFELKPILYGLNNESSMYKLKFYNRSEDNFVEEYNSKLQLDVKLDRDAFKFFSRINIPYQKNYYSDNFEPTIYESYISFNPSESLKIDFGKKTLKWGKGYAWNPVAFLDRQKDPNDPELNMEGYIAVSADYIMSFDGDIKTIAVTPVIMPVNKDTNDDFGKMDKLNYGGKLYLLLFDTDIDFMFLSGGSRTFRYGFDFSKNILSNFEIHGEYAYITDLWKRYIDEADVIKNEKIYANSYLIGIKYLTANDTTYIIEYYRNGFRLSKDEMRNFYNYIYKGYNDYITTGSENILTRANELSKSIYARPNPMGNYLYIKVTQKEPFDILYFTPSVSCIFNINDGSTSVTPEIVYTRFTNIELNFKVNVLSGGKYSEYGEKQNSYKAEFTGRYYF